MVIMDIWYHLPPFFCLTSLMSILAYGLNHRTASLDLRERVAFSPEDLDRTLQALTSEVQGIEEAAIISTCNRTEIYCATDASREEDISHWLTDTRPVTLSELKGASYGHWDQDAARHAIRVASGLDSQMMGEPQIMGQFKSAYEVARKTGTVGPELSLLSRMTLRAAKKIRTHTDIGKNPTSVAYAAVSLADQLFSNLNQRRALLLGAGETAALVAEHLRAKNIAEIWVANRTLENAQILAARVGASAIQLSEVPEHLANFDIVIASTGSTIPVVGKGAVEAAILQRKRRPMLMVDIAVPRDIESGVSSLADVYLYTIDDLAKIIEVNKAKRVEAADSAESIVAEGANAYQRERRLQRGQALLKSFRAQADAVRIQEVERTLKNLEKGDNAEELIQQLSKTLTQKLIHPPTAAIRSASAEGRQDLLTYFGELYDLDPALSEDADQTSPIQDQNINSTDA